MGVDLKDSDDDAHEGRGQGDDGRPIVDHSVGAADDGSEGSLRRPNPRTLSLSCRGIFLACLRRRQRSAQIGLARARHPALHQISKGALWN